jgi:hypothetical protein
MHEWTLDLLIERCVVEPELDLGYLNWLSNPAEYLNAQLVVLVDLDRFELKAAASPNQTRPNQLATYVNLRLQFFPVNDGTFLLLEVEGLMDQINEPLVALLGPKYLVIVEHLHLIEEKVLDTPTHVSFGLLNKG